MTTTQQSIVPGQLTLAGLAHEQLARDLLVVRPYWYVSAALPDFSLHWSLVDETGRLTAAATGRPIFGSRSSSEWPSGTLVDDRYQIRLPAAMPAGLYTLTLALAPGDGGEPTAPIVVGQVSLAAGPDPMPPQTAQAVFRDQFELLGSELWANGQPVHGALPVLRAGSHIQFRLKWRNLLSSPDNVTTLVHLVNDRFTVAKSDQVAGSPAYPTSLWGAGYEMSDVHNLWLAPDAVSGVYEVIVGTYILRDIAAGRIESWLPSETTLPHRGDRVVVGQVKVLGEQPRVSGELRARFGEMAHLVQASVLPAGQSFEPGAALTVTVTFRAHTAAARDLTMFVHVYDPGLGLVAQSDGPPAGGVNPTWSWVRGEVIEETRALTLRTDAPAGQYQVLVGFYDPVTGERVSVTTADGDPHVEGAFPIGQVQIGP